MSHSKYPDINAYHLPKKNVLVLSCMDLRLLDNLLEFLHHDNLTNRYDQFILAGASLCATDKKFALFNDEALTNFNKFTGWRESLQAHIKLAISLHKIKDVYIIEHQDCGAYASFLNEEEVKKLQTVEGEIECHTSFATALADDIHSEVHTDKHAEKDKDKKYNLHVHCFFIDLRGTVKWLYSTP